MNIYLNNDVISDLSLTDSELGVYVALRNIYLSNRDCQVVTFNMICVNYFLLLRNIFTELSHTSSRTK